MASVTAQYRLSCQECDFERTVDGVYRALDVADRHGSNGESPHPVDFHLIEDGESADVTEDGERTIESEDRVDETETD